MKSDEELKQSFKLFTDEKNIIYLDILGYEKDSEDNGRMMELIRDDFLKIFNENPKKIYNIIADLSPIGKINRSGFSSKTRKVGYQLIIQKQIGKSALVTSSLFIRAVMGFIITAAKKSEIVKCFPTKDEALKWLKEE
jgi:hypothetical protein